MDNPAQFDRAALAIVRPGIDGGLTELKGQLDRFWSDPTGQAYAIQAVQREAKRLTGVFKMVGLDGLSVYCAEIEAVLAELANHPESAGAVQRDAIEVSLAALTQYLDDIAQGADNATMRLFGKYQQLQFMRGLEASFELDLFYPALQVQLPASVLDLPQTSDALAKLKAARTQYQQALLRYLRQLDVPAALQLMQRSMLSVMETFPQAHSRAYWWVAAGFFDCLAIQDQQSLGINVSRLLGRIDQQMRMLLEGKPTEELPEMYQMLYLIARTEVVFDGIPTAIKQTYSLQRYIQTQKQISPSMLNKRLTVIAEHLKRAQESWDACVNGSQADCANFNGQIGLIEQYCERLDPNTLQILAGTIAKFGHFASTPEYINSIALDMAMALLLLERGLTGYHQVDDAYQTQALLLSERMHDAVNNNSTTERPLTELVAMYCGQESRLVRSLLSKEMSANLQYIEATLNTYFDDPAKRYDLADLDQSIRQIQGGMEVLEAKSAVELSTALQQTLQRLSAKDGPCERVESRAIANALSALERYITHLLHPNTEMEQALIANAAELVELNEEAQSNDPHPITLVPKHKVETKAISSEDFELIEIFLEEADEVLSIMRENLELCHLQPSNKESLITIRRGFHTLKGSGRMVGLNELGEVAWALERAMNTWLKQDKPASALVKRMVDMAIPKFSLWVDRLRRHGSAEIEAQELLEVALRVEHGQEEQISSESASLIEDDALFGSEEQTPDVVDGKQDETIKSGSAPPQLTLVQSGEQTAAFESQVQVGTVVVAGALFKIGSEESQLHVQTLKDQFAQLSLAEKPHIEYDFMRAAHTLAGVNRAMGFNAIVELAFALESWLQARMEHPFQLKTGQLELLQSTITTLDRMVQNLCARQFPRASGDLVYLLNMDKDKLHVAQEEEKPDVQVAVLADETESTTPAGVESQQERGPQVLDEVDEQLLPIFMEEADDLLPKVGATLRTWRDAPDDEQHVQMLNRLLHTLKGSARMAGAMRIGQVAHEMEDAVLSGKQRVGSAAYWDQLDHEYDRITALLEELRTGEAPAELEVSDQRKRATDKVGEEVIADRRSLDIGAERALQGNMLRVRADVIDRLVNEASEISVARARMEGELRSFKDGLLELTDSVVRLRKQLREVEIQAESQMQARVSLIQDSDQQFDPLEFDRFTRLQELTRFMNESVYDVQTVQHALLKNLDETTAAMSAQARLNRELQQSLMNVRMVPFNSITDRLYRIVRQTGKELNKRANLELLGTSVELDRSVLEKMTAPFEHLLRNAMAHGLESETQRNGLGKQPIGEIRLALRQENNEVVFELSDDGAGLNFEALREKAVALGVLKADEQPSEEQLAQLIFTSGISTATEVTEVAGRGIGMDVVRSEITALGGRVDVSSHSGKGTRFTIHLPLTLAVTQVLMVRCGEATYALPAVMVEQVRQVKAAQLEELYAAGQVDYLGKAYSLHYLPQLLGTGGKQAETYARNSVLLLRSGEARMALHIEELLGNHEAVVKNIGPQLARMPGIAGATVRGNGDVVLILNPLQISQSLFNAAAAPQAAVAEVRKLPLVMVVDDSLTVRKITTRMLTRAGYEVITAKDGVDALEQLNEVMPAVMLLDVEMPRMDGFELTKRLRQDDKTRDLPIIMITSRTADKHRDHALQLGVNAYLGKPYQKDDLLERISGFVSA